MCNPYNSSTEETRSIGSFGTAQLTVVVRNQAKFSGDYTANFCGDRKWLRGSVN